MEHWNEVAWGTTTIFVLVGMKSISILSLFFLFFYCLLNLKDALWEVGWVFFSCVILSLSIKSICNLKEIFFCVVLLLVVDVKSWNTQLGPKSYFLWFIGIIKNWQHLYKVFLKSFSCWLSHQKLKHTIHLVEMEVNDIGCLMLNLFTNCLARIFKNVKRKSDSISIKAPTLLDVNGNNPRIFTLPRAMFSSHGSWIKELDGLIIVDIIKCLHVWSKFWKPYNCTFFTWVFFVLIMVGLWIWWMFNSCGT